MLVSSQRVMESADALNPGPDFFFFRAVDVYRIVFFNFGPRLHILSFFLVFTSRMGSRCKGTKIQNHS